MGLSWLSFVCMWDGRRNRRASWPQGTYRVDVNWEKRMEKHRKGGMGAEEAPAGIVGLGRAQYRAEPRDCPQ